MVSMVSVSMGITIAAIAVSMTVSISRFCGGSRLSGSLAIMVSTVSKTMVSVSMVGIAISITISGLGGGHGGKSNKGKSDTLHNAADYDYVLKSSDGADDLCRTAIPHC